MSRQAYRISEAAEAYAVSRMTLHRAIRAGDLEAKKVGARLVISAAALEKWFEGLPEA